MKKLFLAFQLNSRGLKCDNNGCGYVDRAVPLDYRGLVANLNRPCPVCGSNLLTKADATTVSWMIGAVKVLNVVAFPFMLLCLPITLLMMLLKKPSHKVYRATMDGSGKARFDKAP